MKPRTRFSRFFLVLAVLSAAALLNMGYQQDGQIYEPIPARFGIPTREIDLTASLMRLDVHALREHGWRLFAGLTAPSHSRRRGNDEPLPIWETWYSRDEVFQPPTANRTPGLPVFEFPPEELTPPDKGPTHIVNVSSRIVFNLEARNHIQSNCLYSLDKLNCLLHSPKPIGPDGRPVPRVVPDFPRESVTIKTTWMHVLQNQCTQIPVWDDDPVLPLSPANPPFQWKRRVWVFPPGVSPASCTGAERLPLGALYHFRIVDQKEIEGWQAEGTTMLDPTTGSLNVGDYVVLVGFHAATRELSHWVWTTFWWHDRPDEGPFGSDRPVLVRGVWRHYRMDVAYDMDVPREHDTSPKVAYNPYLEAGLAEGVHSNCMTCHIRAVLPVKPRAATLYSFGDEVEQLQMVVRGSEAATTTYLPDFDDRLQLHFVWSLAAHSKTFPQPLPPACACADPSPGASYPRERGK